jgi:hypothetical protein
MNRLLTMLLLACSVSFGLEQPKNYHFDEGSGNTTGGDANIMGATWIEGFGGHALRFDPANIGHVRIPGYGDKGQSEDLIRTMAAWVRTRAEGGAGLIDVQVLDAVNLRLWEGKVTYQYTEWKDGPLAESNVTINDGKWHYVVGTGDGNDEARIYVDGEEVAFDQTSGRGSVINAFGDIYVGGMLAGDMDEVYVSPHTMGQNEARNRYEDADPAIRDAAALPASTWSASTAYRGLPRMLAGDRVKVPSMVNLRLGALVVALDGAVSGAVYDATGKMVRRITADANGALRWDGLTQSGSTAASGPYMLRIDNGTDQSVHHVTVVGGR